MGVRKVVLATNEIYHTFNRGVEKRNIFLNFREHRNFLLTLRHYIFYPHRIFSKTQEGLEDGSLKEGQLKLEKTQTPLVEILNLCLMPNHFHITLRQKVDRGVSDYMQKVCTSYAKYFNKKYDRTGSLFGGRFKAVRVKSEAQLIHLSKYIHRNPIEKLKGGKEKILYAKNYRWSSLPYYLDNKSEIIEEICNKDDILNLFSSPENYYCFVKAEIEDHEAEVLEEIAIDIEAENKEEAF